MNFGHIRLLKRSRFCFFVAHHVKMQKKKKKMLHLVAKTEFSLSAVV